MSKVNSYKKIIRKFLEGDTGSISEADFNRYAQDPDFLEALDACIEESSYNGLEEPNTDELFSKIKQDPRIKDKLLHIACTKTNTSLSVKRILTVAASALLFTISISAIYYYRYMRSSFSDTLNISQTDQILPGSQKAMIILSDGKRIDLENIPGDSIIDNGDFEIIKSSDGFISYRSKASTRYSSNQTYNTILTPRGGEYKLLLPDGTKVWLNAMTKLRYPIHFEGGPREVELEGEAYFEVAKQNYKGQRIPFIINTSNQKLEVLGTVFNIQNYGNSIVTTLVEGKVKLSYNNSTIGQHYLEPGDQVAFNTSAEKLKKLKVDPFYYCAWKDGNFVFDKTSIQEVMQVISRWYDVDVECADDVNEFEFSGTVSRYEDINKLLQTIELVGGIHFQQKGRKIYVMN